MNLNLKYPQWQEPLAAAIIEFYCQHLDGKLEQAEEAIHARFQELSNKENAADESRALHDGLSLIRGVRKDKKLITEAVFLGTRDRPLDDDAFTADGACDA